MEVVATLPPRLALAQVGDEARRLERLGFDTIHVPETVHDSLAMALVAVEHTDTIRVRTSMTLAFPRSPIVVAQAAETWDAHAKRSSSCEPTGIRRAARVPRW